MYRRTSTNFQLSTTVTASKNSFQLPNLVPREVAQLPKYSLGNGQLINHWRNWDCKKLICFYYKRSPYLTWIAQRCILFMLHLYIIQWNLSRRAKRLPVFAINYEVRGIFSIYFTITGTESTFCHTEGFVKLMFYGNLYIRKNEHFLDKKCCNPKIKKKKQVSYYIRPPPYNGNHSLMVTFICPKGDRCVQVPLY